MVILREDETLDHALLRLKRQASDNLEEYRARRYYKSKAQRRNAKDWAAKKLREKLKRYKRK